MAGVVIFSGCGPQDEGEPAISEDAVAGDNAAVAWSRIAQAQIIDTARKNSQAASQYMAYVTVAMYEASNAILGGYTPYTEPALTAPAGASADAAIAAAAHYVLLQKLPAQATSIDTAYNNFLAGIPNGSAKTDGIAVGEAAGVRILSNRASDGVEANDPVTIPPPGPGVWNPLPGQTPLAPWARHAQPWTMTSVDQFRAPPPPPLNSGRYATDFDEVKTFGCSTCSARTAAQTEIALFWSENTMTTWSRALQQFAVDHSLGLAETARFFALAHMAIADGNTACWDTKFTYMFWRPEVAIHQADTDGNPNTTADASWVPLLATPAHPDWTSGHTCQTGAAVQVIRRLFGASVTYTVESRVTNTIHTFTRFDGSLDEVVDARVWSGIHTRGADERGAHMGTQVGQQAASNFLRPRSLHR